MSCEWDTRRAQQEADASRHAQALHPYSRETSFKVLKLPSREGALHLLPVDGDRMYSLKYDVVAETLRRNGSPNTVSRGKARQ